MRIEYFKEYIDKGIAVIPVYSRWDDKKNSYFGKYSCVEGWNNYSENIPTDEDIAPWANINGCSGIAYVCGIASNLCCIDIDTEDPVLAEEIAKVLPYTPCRILGNPKRYGKLLYRLTDFPATYNNNKTKNKITKFDQTVVDALYSKCYVVAPPSMHSCNKDGSNINYYRWYDPTKTLEIVGVENLPVVPDDAFFRMSQIVNGSSTSFEVNRTSPPTVHGRFDTMKKFASGLSKGRTPIEQSVREILRIDAAIHEGNHFFADRSKGFKTKSELINANKYYADMLVFFNEKMCLEEPRFEMEAPPIYLEKFPDPIEIQEEQQLIENFDSNYVPDNWRDLVVNVADSNGVPQEACFFLLLTALSSLIGNKITITAKRKNKSWKEAFNIWTIYVSPSGTRKSQMLKTLTVFINELQKEIDVEYNKYIETFNNDKEIKDEQIRTYQSMIKKEVTCSIQENGMVTEMSRKEVERLQKTVSDLQHDAELQPKQQIVAKGATVEKLIEILGANKTGTYLEYNELTQLTSLFKKKGYESLRTLLLDSWDGLGNYSYQTKNSGSVFIEKLCSSLYGAIQNSVFKNDLREIALDINDDGFYQRSFIIENSSPVATAIDEEFSVAKYSKVKDTFIDAYNMGESDTTIGTEDEAYYLMMNFEQKMLSMAASEKISALGSFWGKFTGKVVKIAGILEFIKKGRHMERISYSSMKESIYLMNRQILFIKNMFPDPFFEHAREIKRFISLGVIKDGFDHDKMMKVYAPFKDTKTFNAVIDILYRHHIVDFKTRDCKVYYYFNPKIKPSDSKIDFDEDL